MKESCYPRFSIANLVDRLLNRRFVLPDKVDKDIKIFVFQHFNVELPECFADRSIYVPLQGGKQHSVCVLRDDTPPSIAEYNVYLNEMTQIYWVGKHYDQLGNPEFVGFAHYRRCLDWNPQLLSPGVVFASRFVSHLSNWNFFVSCHGDKWLNKFMKEFHRVFDSGDYFDIDEYWKTRTMYIANNFITDRDTFLRYFSFTEKVLKICLEMLAKHIDEFRQMNKSQRRQFSYIMERVTSYWIWHEKMAGRIKVVSSRLRCYDIDNGLSSVR